MASMTIPNIPALLLQRLERKASRDDRSIDEEAIHLLEQALAPAGRESEEWTRADIQEQYRAWCELGTWESDRSAEEEIHEIYSRRTAGRTIEL